MAVSDLPWPDSSQAMPEHPFLPSRNRLDAPPEPSQWSSPPQPLTPLRKPSLMKTISVAQQESPGFQDVWSARKRKQLLRGSGIDPDASPTQVCHRQGIMSGPTGSYRIMFAPSSS